MFWIFFHAHGSSPPPAECDPDYFVEQMPDSLHRCSVLSLRGCPGIIVNKEYHYRKEPIMQRREFLKSAALTALASTLSHEALGAASGMPYRTLGRTGEKVSLVGLGGHHIGRKYVSQEEGIRIIRTGLDSGVNFLDNCWDYNDGESERRMGLALKDGYRQKAFLMTKL